jgi:hypothetical protein
VKLADIEAGGAKQAEALPNMTGTAFYITYHITAEGIPFPYYDENSFAVYRVDEARTTRVPVPALERGAFTQVYVKITNNGDFSLTFRKGTSELTPDGAASTIVINREAAPEGGSRASCSGRVCPLRGIHVLPAVRGFAILVTTPKRRLSGIRRR